MKCLHSRSVLVRDGRCVDCLRSEVRALRRGASMSGGEETMTEEEVRGLVIIKGRITRAHGETPSQKQILATLAARTAERDALRGLLSRLHSQVCTVGPGIVYCLNPIYNEVVEELGKERP